jgi:hypothetical protein
MLMSETAPEEMARAMFSLIKPYYKEGKQRVKGQRRKERERSKPAAAKVTLKDAIFEVMEEAIATASNQGRYPFSARDLFYAVRPLYIRHTENRLNPDGGYKYFGDLIQEYQREHGKIEGLYYDPRGRLREPHTGNTVDIGTREVEAYEFPHLTYDKILYIEKEGVWPQLEHAMLAERYDMAVLTGKGYATEAARTLFDRAEQGDYQLFVFHDADPDGYNIARTLRDETARMPGYNVDVQDIGLTIEDAEAMNLEPDPFVRKKDLPSGLDLTERERECFEGRYKARDGNGKVLYECIRYEINALKSAPQKVGYIERKLAERGVRGKLMPPDTELGDLAGKRYRDLSDAWVAAAMRELLSEEGFEEVADELLARFELSNARRYIREVFDEDRSLSWRAALDKRLRHIHAEHADDLKATVAAKLRERLQN